MEATGGAKLSRLWTLPRGVAGGLPLGTTGAWTSSVGGSGDAVSSPVRSATERGARGESRTLGVRASLCALGGTGQVTGSEKGREKTGRGGGGANRRGDKRGRGKRGETGCTSGGTALEDGSGGTALEDGWTGGDGGVVSRHPSSYGAWTWAVAMVGSLVGCIVRGTGKRGGDRGGVLVVGL